MNHWIIVPVVLPALLRLGAGVALAALPLALWHGLQGSFGAWLEDSFLTPWRIAGQQFLAYPGYTHLAVLALDAPEGLPKAGLATTDRKSVV